MNAKKGAVVMAAVAGILGAGLAGCKSDGSSKPAMEKSSCKGMNACKGQGGCKTDANACKGMNACKGLGGCSTK